MYDLSELRELVEQDAGKSFDAARSREMLGLPAQRYDARSTAQSAWEAYAAHEAVVRARAEERADDWLTARWEQDTRAAELQRVILQQVRSWLFWIAVALAAVAIAAIFRHYGLQAAKG